MLTLDYLQRDEEIAHRLATDLEAKLQEMCQILIPIRVGCPSDLHVHLRLSSQPDSLLALADMEKWLQSGTELLLPTPTLVGIPTTEAAYQALFRNYAARVLSAVITHLTGYHCCLYRAVLDKQLNQLGVSPWPLATANFLNLLPHFAPLRELEPVWLLSPQDTLTGAERWLLYALVDLLVEERGLQPAALLPWRQNLFASLPTSKESAEAVWWKYIYEQAAKAQPSIPAASPYPWPEQALYLTCQNHEGESGLYRYEVGTGAWTKERVLGEESAALLPLPDDSGMVISVGVLPEKETFVLRADGTESPLSAAPGNVSLPLKATADPRGRYLLLEYSSTAPNVFIMVYLDIDSCDKRGCNLIPASQETVWSPDGSQRLTWANGRLQRGHDLNGALTAVSPPGVYAPFWWHDNVPGYVAGLGDRIMIVPGESEHPEVWLIIDDLVTAVPPEIKKGSWRIREVYTAPHATSFLVAASRRGRPGSHLFLVRDEKANIDQWTAPTIFYLRSLPHLRSSLRFSPDGHWLAIPIFAEDSARGQQLVLYDLGVPEMACRATCLSQRPSTHLTGQMTAVGWHASGMAFWHSSPLVSIRTGKGTRPAWPQRHQSRSVDGSVPLPLIQNPLPLTKRKQVQCDQEIAHSATPGTPSPTVDRLHPPERTKRMQGPQARIPGCWPSSGIFLASRWSKEKITHDDPFIGRHRHQQNPLRRGPVPSRRGHLGGTL